MESFQLAKGSEEKSQAQEQILSLSDGDDVKASQRPSSQMIREES